METLRDLDLVREYAAPHGPCALRATGADDGTGLGRLTVRFSPFNTWYEVDSFWEGTFMERTKRGAFKKTMKENRAGVRILFDHGHDMQVGNKVLAAVDDLREDADSAVAEGDLFDTSYNRDLEPGLRAGVYGSSFRFRVVQESWNDEPGVSDDNPKGLPERTINEVRLFEAGPVTFPANPAATAAVRSATDHYYESLRTRAPQEYEELRARATALRQRGAADGTPRPVGAAPLEPVEPAVRHSDGMTPRERRVALFPIFERV